MGSGRLDTGAQEAHEGPKNPGRERESRGGVGGRRGEMRVGGQERSGSPAGGAARASSPGGCWGSNAVSGVEGSAQSPSSSASPFLHYT